MKRTTWIVFVTTIIIAVPWCNAHANFINVISQEYEIWGEGIFDGKYAPPGQSFHIISDTSPISQHISDNKNFFDEEGQMVGSGYYYSYALSDGGVTFNNAWLHAYANADDAGNGYSTASASASIIFTPILYSMVFTITYENVRASQHYIHLLDLTYNISLLPSNEDPFWAIDPVWEDKSITLLFDPTHEYSMSIEIPFINFIDREFCASLTPVPEPTTMLFLCFSLVGLAVMRKGIY